MMYEIDNEILQTHLSSNLMDIELKFVIFTHQISKQPSSGSFIKSSRKRSSEAAGCSSLPKNSKRFCQTKLIDPQPLSGGSGSSDDQLQVVYSDGSCTKNGRIGAQAGIGVYWRPGDERYNYASYVYFLEIFYKQCFGSLKRF